jgi:hypothetical protein
MISIVVIVNVVVLITTCIDSLQDYMVVLYLAPINMYVNIFGIVFATGIALAILITTSFVF